MPGLSTTQHGTISLSRLLGTGEDVPRERYQEPKLQQTKRGVWFIRPWVDVIRNGRVERAKKRIIIGVMGKREAQARAREVMATINRAEYVISSQVRLDKFLIEYQKLHVERLAASTRGKYESHIRNHIQPAFGSLMLCEIHSVLVQQWLDAKAVSWATKTDIRNILSSIFTQAIGWGIWKDANPIERVSAGREVAAREKRKMTDEDIRRLLAALPEDVRLLVVTCLITGLRISEALGLQEKHLEFETGVIAIRQRFYRGDLDVPKNKAAKRNVPMGHLAGDLKRICLGDPERFVFQIKTHENWTKPRYCRDDRDIHQHFLRPVAKALGLYWTGFGFHTFRREAITALQRYLPAGDVMRLAGHTTMDMLMLYTLPDLELFDKAVRQRQEQVMGKAGEKIQ